MLFICVVHITNVKPGIRFDEILTIQKDPQVWQWGRMEVLSN